MRVLIAEDDSVSRRILELHLRKWGYDVESTVDGDEAWAALQRPDAAQLAVLDWMMPGIEGVEICRRVRAMASERPMYLILLTALHTKDFIVEGLEAGADDYLTKPFDQAELRARIRVAERVLNLNDALALRIEELQHALDHVRTLQGILPICMHCKAIRTDDTAWQRIDHYIAEHSDTKFSHGLCPTCFDEHYPDDGDDDAGGDEATEPGPA